MELLLPPSLSLLINVKNLDKDNIFYWFSGYGGVSLPAGFVLKAQMKSNRCHSYSKVNLILLKLTNLIKDLTKNLFLMPQAINNLIEQNRSKKLS